MDLRLRTRPSAGAIAGQSESAMIVEVAGELDLHCAPQLRAEVARAIEADAPPHIVIDLSGVTFLDSTGVGVLVGALKRAREADGELHFCSAQPRVRRVFEITGLIGALPLFDTRTEALDALGDGAQEAAQETAQLTAQPRFNSTIISAGEAQ